MLYSQFKKQSVFTTGKSSSRPWRILIFLVEAGVLYLVVQVSPRGSLKPASLTSDLGNQLGDQFPESRSGISDRLCRPCLVPDRTVYFREFPSLVHLLLIKVR